MSQNTTVADLLQRGYRTLADTPGGRLDAELLLAQVLGRGRAWLHTWPDAPVNEQHCGEFDKQLARRADGVPLAYLTGEREFWSLTLTVTPDTLIPRPETETLVEFALTKISGAATVIDLGTGTGAIALAIAAERAQATVVATDISRDALQVARDNAQRCEVDIALLQSDWLHGYQQQAFDFIACNPPYIAEADPHLVGDGVRHEPRGALVAGRDGLGAIRTIAAQAGEHLRPGGWLAVEHGHTQGAQVRKLLGQHGLVNVETLGDAQGNDRVTVACRQD